MKYKEALQQSMKNLAKDKKTLFVGYNCRFGSLAYGVLKDVPKSQILETPLAESLMMGIAIGASLRGYKPIVCVERHDFLFGMMDQIVNHLDKMEEMSKGQFAPKVLIRATVGGQIPFNPGIQHTQNYTEALRRMVKYLPIFELHTPDEILWFYNTMQTTWHSAIVVEWRDLYDI